MKDAMRKIYDLMQEQKISYGELSRRTGLSKSTLSRYVNGEIQKVPADRLTLIASALGTTIAYLLGWDDEEQMIDGMQQLDRDIERQFQEIKKLIIINQNAKLFELIMKVSVLDDANIETLLQLANALNK